MANEPDNLILVHLREIRATLAEHSARFDRIDERFTQMDQRFVQIDERFHQMDLRFAQIDERFAQMDLRFAQIDERFAQMDLRFAQIDERFVQVDLRFDRMEQRFDGLRDVVDHTFVLSAANSRELQELDRRYQFSEGEQQRISGRVDELDNRLSDVEKKIEK